ncbi:unnamed protein product [Lymnaea stagnalis]|uniref:Uncharacterized protein n=1 Tax=Lymnaea stagnalis TaxID=6523 RepID=A0AAV2HMF4_LYMST
MPKRLNRETVVESVLDNSIDNKEVVNKSRTLEKNNSNKLHSTKSRTVRSNASKGALLESVDRKQAHNLNRLTAEVSTNQIKKQEVTKISSCDSDHEDISGISFKFSQEPLLNSSQDDSFCDVKWDCGSPETIQKVKRWRGHYNAESVKNAVSYFSDIHVKSQKNASSSSKVGTILHSKDLFALATKSRPHKGKERICKKKPHDFQEMVDSFLQDLTKKNQTGK